MSFIRFIPVNYNLESQSTPLSLPEPPCDEEEYMLPTNRNDVLKFIVDKSEFDNLGYDVATLKVGLTNEGILVAGDLGTVEESEFQYFVTVTIPSNIPFSCYNFVIYSGLDPIDCGQFAGATWGDLENYTWGQFANCIWGDFNP